MDIIALAQEFGLACIQRGNIYYIIGKNDIIELNIDSVGNPTEYCDKAGKRSEARPNLIWTEPE